jgi:colanic acid/amylovoran biosynthesis glycosyltransferase
LPSDTNLQTGKRLVMIAPAPVIMRAGGKARLDSKFVEGMRMHARIWGGTVHGIIWEGAESIPFGAEYDLTDLGFTLEMLKPDQDIGTDQLKGASVVAASADLAKALALPKMCMQMGAGLVYSVEYTLRTRLDIVALDRSRSLLRKAWSAVWHLREERRRRAAFAECDGVQFNGYPAQHAYAGMTRDGLLYLDGRMRQAMMATEAEMQDRALRLATGAPVRIVHSGRLATMKGAQDLIPVALALRDLGANFRLDIFGTGELDAEIAANVQSLGLSEIVELHAPVDFETELVPYLRSHADIFLSCHRQADPSCTYLESFGCGLPVIGYDNEMWRDMQQASGAGWVVPMGQTDKLAERLADVLRNPSDLSSHAAQALAFAKAHDFETEFTNRMRHYARHAKG